MLSTSSRRLVLFLVRAPSLFGSLQERTSLPRTYARADCSVPASISQLTATFAANSDVPGGTVPTGVVAVAVT